MDQVVVVVAGDGRVPCGGSGVRRWLHGLLAVVIVVSVFAGVGTARSVRAETVATPIPADENFIPKKVFFPETGHNIAPELLGAWNRTGLMIIGYPISEPMMENGRLVQYFERSRLEYWPENAASPEWTVQGTLLGNWLAEKRRNEKPFQRIYGGEREGCNWYEPTGHYLCFGFKEYWEENGGLWQYGYPISEEFTEVNSQDGKTYTVQYFERARFEWHPEHRGTPYEVLLGHLGREYAASKKIATQPVEQAPDAVRYDIGLFEENITRAFRPNPDGWMGYVSSGELGIHSAPDPAAPTVDVIYNRRPIEIKGIVRGKPVENGIDAWYLVGPNMYVSAAHIDPLVLPTPAQTFAGHWVDVNLSRFYAVAYDGSTPRYVAIIAAGREGRTPTGVFSIFSRVRSETMNSATVGFGPGHPEYYYLENVEFTQYFEDGGFALHGNYWTPENRFGNFTSNGCVGMLNADAEFFWNWLDFGSTVSIHY